MTQSHDSEARLKMLRETIERNRDRLLDHEIEEPAITSLDKQS